MKYTEDILFEAIDTSNNWTEVCIKLEVSTTGGSRSHIKKLADKWKIDYNHFQSNGKGWSKGLELINKRKSAQDILTKAKIRSPQAYQLRRALIESGIRYQCSNVNCIVKDTWLDKKLVLQIDHINGNKLDNKIENLRFLCPNCHSQTDTWGTKNIK